MTTTVPRTQLFSEEDRIASDVFSRRTLIRGASDLRPFVDVPVRLHFASIDDATTVAASLSGNAPFTRVNDVTLDLLTGVPLWTLRNVRRNVDSLTIEAL